MKIFHLPDLGEGLAEAEIREWYVREGDMVQLDQPLLSVETAKAVVDVPSPYPGRIVKLHGKVHEVIKTHAPLVEFENESIVADKGSIVGKLEETQTPLQEEAVIIGAVGRGGGSFKIMPAVRALAKQLNVDLNTVTPTGPKGQITAEDIKRQIKPGSAAAGQASILEKGEGLHGVRRMMAQVMSGAHQAVAQVTIIDEVDIGHLPTDADITVLLLQAMVAAAKTEPALNAWFDGNNLERQLFSEVNIGVAMDTPEGLFVPVLKSVNTLSAQALRNKVNEYKDSVRSRKIAASDMQGATISLSNFGTIAGKYASPIVVPPMVAILGSGRCFETVMARKGRPVVTRVLPLSLSTDHRAVTGGEAVRFLAAVIDFVKKSL